MHTGLVLMILIAVVVVGLGENVVFCLKYTTTRVARISTK